AMRHRNVIVARQNVGCDLGGKRFIDYTSMVVAKSLFTCLPERSGECSWRAIVATSAALITTTHAARTVCRVFFQRDLHLNERFTLVFFETLL
ncbi:MAG: hypothetical protein ACRCWJ_21145, partial [Casimicrobium sp.]